MTTDFTIYNESTGEVQRTLVVDPDLLGIQLQAGEAAIAGRFPRGKYIVWDGEPIPVTPSLEDVRATKLDDLRAHRESLESADFTWNGSAFKARPTDQIKLMGAAMRAQLAGPSYIETFTLADDTSRTLTGPEVLAVGVALATRISHLHQTHRDKVAEVSALTDVNDVANYSVSSGWPT